MSCTNLTSLDHNSPYFAGGTHKTIEYSLSHLMVETKEMNSVKILPAVEITNKIPNGNQYISPLPEKCNSVNLKSQLRFGITGGLSGNPSQAISPLE